MFQLDRASDKVSTSSGEQSSSLNSLDLLKNDDSFSINSSVIDKVGGNISKLDVGNIWNDVPRPHSFLGLPSPGDLFRNLPSPGDIFNNTVSTQ